MDKITLCYRDHIYTSPHAVSLCLFRRTRQAARERGKFVILRAAPLTRGHEIEPALLECTNLLVVNEVRRRSPAVLLLYPRHFSIAFSRVPSRAQVDMQRVADIHARAHTHR